MKILILAYVFCLVILAWAFFAYRLRKDRKAFEEEKKKKFEDRAKTEAAYMHSVLSAPIQSSKRSDLPEGFEQKGHDDYVHESIYKRERNNDDFLVDVAMGIALASIISDSSYSPPNDSSDSSDYSGGGGDFSGGGASGEW